MNHIIESITFKDCVFSIGQSLLEGLSFLINMTLENSQSDIISYRLYILTQMVDESTQGID